MGLHSILFFGIVHFEWSKFLLRHAREK